MHGDELVWQAINAPLRPRLQDAVDRRLLPSGFAVGLHATALQALVDGLVVHLATTPQLVSAQAALAVLDGYLASLCATPPDVDPSGPGSSSHWRVH